MGCSCSSNFSGTEEAQSEQLTNELYEQWLLAEGGGRFGGQNLKRGFRSMVPWVVLAVSLGVGLYVSNIVIKKE